MAKSKQQKHNIASAKLLRHWFPKSPTDFEGEANSRNKQIDRRKRAQFAHNRSKGI